MSLKSKKSGAGGRQSKNAPAPKRQPRGADRRLEDALEAVAEALGDLDAPWMLIGGLAVVARGVRRATTDIDVVVKGDEADVKVVVSALAAHEIAPRRADAEAFARENLVLLARHRPTGVDLDLSFAWSAFEFEALAARSFSKLGRVRLPIAQPEDLVIFKAVAGRAKDASDIEALLTIYPELDLPRVRRSVKVLAELADAPEMLEALEALLLEATANRRR